VAFATAPAERLGPNDTDRPHHEAAARAAGIELDHVVWSDPDADWSSYDLVVVRSTWDYLHHLEDFGVWLAAMEALGTLQNPASVVRWNLDKRYLVDLAASGVPVISTRVCGDTAAVAAALDAVAGAVGEVVVKPVVSAGSHLTGRFAAGDPGAARLADQILDGGTAVLVQPAVRSVATEGEVAALVFGGTVSHAVRKAPILALGGGLVGGTYTERVAREELSPDRREVVDAASAAVAGLVADGFGVLEPLLYARIDLVTLDDGSIAVLEVELAEPTFFLDVAPEAAERFAALVAERAATATTRGRPRPGPGPTRPGPAGHGGPPG
jgi:glutathione synthase/RimK-type ligase-like ATP-grasp enzyme